MSRFVAAIICVVALLQGAPVHAGSRAFRVVHYEARLEPDIAAKSVVGIERIDVVADAPGVAQLEFDAGALDVQGVSIEGAAAPFEKQGARLIVRLPQPLAAGLTHKVQVAFRGQPKYGLEFHADPAQVYTIFSTSQWLVCLDDPSVRATLDLSVLLPRGFIATGSGVQAVPVEQPDGRLLFRWRQDTPVPSFTYGFAGGQWREARESVEGTELRYLSARRDDRELRQVFADTAHMVRFMSAKAGTRLHSPRYEQALVASTIGQEAAGFALMSEDYGQRVLSDASNAGLMAHEVAHQWWGVMVTCEDWGHFWLNEGFATFMAAVWMGDRFGPAEYERSLNAWKARVARLWAEGKDHALVYASWNRPTADDRAVVYTRGAYTLHLLREEMGDAAFWKAVAVYTQRHWGRSVKTSDFQAAAEEAAGRSLQGFFDKWVYARP